jgi:hypothetical protein
MSTETSIHDVQSIDHERCTTAGQFVSFYSSIDEPFNYLHVEHRSETAAQRGSWQSAAMRAHFIYRGYKRIEITERTAP